MNTPLARQWIVITGASSGFGAAAALAFARQGAQLLLGARRLDRLETVVQQARTAGSPGAYAHPLDVSDTASAELFAKWVRQHTSHLHLLVNNAGGAKGLDPVAHATDADWDFMVQTNLLGVLRMTRALLPLLTIQPGGMILNIGSVAGHTAYEGGAAYCAVKAGERQITRALRLELCGTGVRVGTLDPGLAETEFSLVRFHGDAERARKVYEGVKPLSAEDVADAMVWMASRPPHVCIDELVIKPTDQAEVYKIHRRA
jgi:3-hydroxy acid dehydrogenase / malonic semialdehyde reductase